jgi:hypothetical protein
MSHDPHAQMDQTVLDLIEQSPAGAVPHTPAYQDALRRLQATHQVYPSADHKGGHVTARSLAKLPFFHADNLDAFAAGRIDATALEANGRIFDRYVASLPETLRRKAETHRAKVVGRAIQHRKHHGACEVSEIHDPVRSLFLVPGTGLHPGLPGNYLHGTLGETLHAGAPSTWSLALHDAEDGASALKAATLTEALGVLHDVLASAPFALDELDALGFSAK